MESYKFVTPYTTSNKIRRIIWNICWTLLARPFPRNMFMPWNLGMKDYACIGPGVDCYNAAPIVIGNHATISQRTYLCTASHDLTSATHPQIEKPIVIEDRAWVAAEAFVGPGVTIGEGAVVGARGCVFKDVEPWTVVGGIPARFIKKRTIKDE